MKSIIVDVSGVKIGKGCPLVVQTMCNTHTADIDSSYRQCIELAAAGARIIRLTTQGPREVAALKEIKQKLRSEGIQTPLVADVHFSSEVAILAASVADKVRINPGNFAPDHEKAKVEFKKFIQACKEHGTAVRIGINHGSLGKRITELYGNTPKGMKEAMAEWVEMCIEEDFYNVVLSLKASNTLVMVQAYRMLNDWMKSKGILFPLHLGVTEAGNGDMGRIKSALGIAALLNEGIGDTIRVSLTEPPVNEVPVAQYIADLYSSAPVRMKNRFETDTFEHFIIEASCSLGPALLDKKIDDFSISASCAGEELDSAVIQDFKDNLFQAARRRFTKCEYVACPGCGRTMYNLEETFNEVKKRTSHLKGFSIAVMGCIVNGPGEMADADYGYVGQGAGKVALYRGKEPVRQSIPQEEAIDALLALIRSDSEK